MSWNKICETWMDSQSIQKVIFIGNRVAECFIDEKDEETYQLSNFS